MPLYFFDIHDGVLSMDDVGSECADLDTVRREAKRLLPAMAQDLLPQDGDNRTLTVLVRDAQDAVIYTATLMFNGVTVRDPATP